MVTMKDHASHRSGFALIIVLSTLAILTLLLSVSTRLSLAHVQSQETEVLLAERSALSVALLRAVGEVQAGEVFEVTLGKDTYRLRAVDVGGLIDLNTARPPLLEAYLAGIGMTSEEVARFRAWRRTSKRLLRVEDLIRVARAEGVDRELLLSTATVHSGRPGVSLEDAPEALRVLLEPRWQEDWASASSGVNFRIQEATARRRKLGSVHDRPSEKMKVFWAK